MRITAVLLAVTLALLTVSLALAGQDRARSYKFENDALAYAELSKAPQKARARRNPLEKDPDAVAAGRNLFEQHCTECHGDSAEGSRKGPSLLVEPVQSAEPGTIFWILTNGVVWRGMPVWSKLPEPQRWQLVSYIKSLGVAKTTPESAPQPTDRAPKASVLPPR
jgi:mono/diheme cytochrome c family protein